MRKSLNTKLANKEKSALSTEKLEKNEFYAVVNRQRLKRQYISRRNTDYIAIVVAIAQRIHLYSSRTQKLSSAAPKVLDGQLSGRIGRRHIIFLDSSAAEHPAVNRRVVGSNPTRGVKAEMLVRPIGQAVKTSPFHGGNSGSIPEWVIIRII